MPCRRGMRESLLYYLVTVGAFEHSDRHFLEYSFSYKFIRYRLIRRRFDRLVGSDRRRGSNF